MPKTNLQRKTSYYEKIIAESKKSPLTPMYKDMCSALEELVKFSRELNNPKVKMTAAEFETLQSHYRATKKACSDYLSADITLTTFEKDRKGIIESISRLLDKDMAVLDKCDAKEPGSLSEIIGRSRSHTVHLKEKDVQTVGAALSSRIPLKTPSGKKGFFTPTSIYNIDDKWAAQVESHMAQFKDELDKYPQIKTALEKIKTDPNIMDEFCTFTPHDKYEAYIGYTKRPIVRMKMANVGRMLGLAPTAEAAEKIMDNDVMGVKKAVINIVNSMAHLANQYSIMRLSGINKGSNISHRNCAMSDVADLFGCSDLVAKSVPMKIKIDGREVEGVFMETVEGSDVNNIKEDDIILKANRDSFNSPRAMMQLTELQVLDYICGNTDRHGGNIIYKFGKDKQGQVVLKGIQGIDNDCSFGRICPKPGVDVMKLVNPEKMQYITPRMMNKLQTITPEALEMQLAHYNFSKSEKAALKQRLQNVKDAIANRTILPADKAFWEANPIAYAGTMEGNYLHRIQKTALKSLDGYQKPEGAQYKEIHYMKDRRQSNKVLLDRADKVAEFRDKMNKVKKLFNSSEYNMMEKRFKLVERFSKQLKAESKGRAENVSEDISYKLEKAYEELADKTLRYINLKKLVPSTGKGILRREFAQELMEFADDTLQEMTKNPELESENAKNQPAEIENSADEKTL